MYAMCLNFLLLAPARRPEINRELSNAQATPTPEVGDDDTSTSSLHPVVRETTLKYFR